MKISSQLASRIVGFAMIICAITPFICGPLLFPPAKTEYVALIDAGRRLILLCCLSVAWIGFVSLFQTQFVEQHPKYQLPRLALGVICAIITVIALQQLNANLAYADFVALLALMGLLPLSKAFARRGQLLRYGTCIAIIYVGICYFSFVASSGGISISKAGIALCLGLLGSFPFYVEILSKRSQQNQQIEQLAHAHATPQNARHSSSPYAQLMPFAALSSFGSTWLLLGPATLAVLTSYGFYPRSFLLVLAVVPFSLRLLIHLQISRYSCKLPPDSVPYATGISLLGIVLVSVITLVHRL